MELDIDWISPSRRSPSIGGGANGIRVSMVRVTSGKKPQAQTTIRLGLDVMKRCGFLLGDRVAIGFAAVDGQKVMAIKRVNDGGGYAISNPRIKEFRGTNKSWGVVKIAELDIPQGQVPMASCVIRDDVMIVPLAELR